MGPSSTGMSMSGRFPASRRADRGAGAGSGSSSSSYSYSTLGLFRISSTISTSEMWKAPRNRPACTRIRMRPAPSSLNIRLNSSARVPLHAPPLWSSRPEVHSPWTAAKLKVKSVRYRNRWRIAPITAGVRRAHQRRSRTGRPRWKARI